MTGPSKSKYTCGNCYTEFDLPDDGRCPTCKVREIVPMDIGEMRDLEADREWLKSVHAHYAPGDMSESGNIAIHAIDRAIAAEKERDKWKAEAELQRLLFTDEFETAMRYMRERDEARKFVEELETLIIKAKDDIRAGAAGFAAVDIVRYFNQKELTHENQ